MRAPRSVQTELVTKLAKARYEVRQGKSFGKVLLGRDISAANGAVFGV